MKINKTLIYIAVGVCTMCLFIIPYGKRICDQIPDYKWDTHHMGNTKSKEPFGAKYLDEYLHEYWKGKVYVESDVDTALAKYGKRRMNYLFVNAEGDYYDSIHIARYISKANIGNRMLFAGLEQAIIENLTINLENENNGMGFEFDVRDFLNNPQGMKRITLFLKNSKNDGKPHSITTWGNMTGWVMNSALELDSINTYTDYYDCYGDIPMGTYTSLISTKSKKDQAARRDIGKGCITFSLGYTFFTNYAVSDDELRVGMEHLMEATFDRSLPLVIIYNSGVDFTSGMDNGTMFGVLLERPSTALFIWLLCIALVLVIFVNGRRRRRAETVREKAHNSSINYIRHLATIYTDETNYNELLRIEKRVLLYRLRKEYYFDMRTRDFTEVSQFAEHIASTKGLKTESVREVLTTLEELTANSVEVDAQSYRLCLGQLATIK